MPLSDTAQHVENWLTARGLPGRVREMTASTRTSAEAAAAIGCGVAQIAKSLVCRGRDSGAPLPALDPIRAAAGTPVAVFSLTPEELVALTSGEVVDIKIA